MGREVVISIAPRALSEKDAARYLSLSVSGFRSLVATAIRSIKLGQRRKAYLREDLDRWLDHQAGIAPTPTLTNPWDKFK